MDKDTWMKLIHHLWVTVGYWQLAENYRKNNLRGWFFEFTGFAIQDKLVLLIAHTVQLCEEVTNAFDVGINARETLREIKNLYEKGQTQDRSKLKFEDCGIKVYRDRVTAHPCDHIKDLLGKEPYRISLKWDTVQQTLEKIKDFCREVEEYHEGKWQMSTCKGEVEAVNTSFQEIMFSLNRAAKYRQFEREVILRGKATLVMDWQSRELIIEK